MALASGFISIIDASDAVTLTGYTTSNSAKNVMYNPDTKASSPEWSSVNLVLTPTIFAAGTTNEILTYYLSRIKTNTQLWRYRADGAAPVTINVGGGTSVTDSSLFTVSLGANGSPGTAPTLTVKKNVFGTASDNPAGSSTAVNGITFEYECIYTDPNTGLDTKFTQSIDFSRLSNSASIANAFTWAPQGNIFKNALIATLTAQTDLWRGAVTDSTNVQYYWYKQDSTGQVAPTANIAVAATSATVASGHPFYVGQVVGFYNGTNTEYRTIISSGTDATHIAWASGLTNPYTTANGTIYDYTAGMGWRLCTTTWPSPGITGASSINGSWVLSQGANTITIPAATVINYGTFKCGVKDVDTLSPTYNQYFWDTITFNDQTDPSQVTIFSTGGDVFKNAAGSTVLIAKLYQNGSELDTLTGVAEPTPGVVAFGLAANRPASPTNPSWYMATDTGTLTKYTGSWGSSITKIGGTYTKTYIWSLYDTNGAQVSFSSSSAQADTYTDAACTTLAGGTGNAAGPYRKGKWIFLDGNDVTGKATIKIDVT